MCKEQKLPVLVFDFKKSGNIRGVIEGKSIGTLIHA
jgi:uridylate kinase